MGASLFNHESVELQMRVHYKIGWLSCNLRKLRGRLCRPKFLNPMNLRRRNLEGMAVNEQPTPKNQSTARP